MGSSGDSRSISGAVLWRTTRVRRRTDHALDDTMESCPTDQNRGRTRRTRGMERYQEQYRGFQIIARALKGGWQAKIEGIGALSDQCSTALDAISETKRYLDQQAVERWPPRHLSGRAGG